MLPGYNPEQNHIHVTCAIIEAHDKVLTAQRSQSMRIPMKWEFPGGKVEPAESLEECLKREMLEELGIEVCINRALPAVTHDYPSLRVSLYPFICRIVSGEPTPLEHNAINWVLPENLMSIDWAEADIPVVEEYLRMQDE